MVVKWLSNSGLKVNESKTEMCIFYKRDTHPMSIEVNGAVITSSSTMNVLGVIFDSKLQWSNQVANSIRKANAALHAIKLIKTFFNEAELLSLITSNFYSILYYNSEIWQINTLSPRLKQLLLSASAKALKTCMRFNDRFESFEALHDRAHRATPARYSLYKHAQMLHKLYNAREPDIEWINLNFQHQFSMRQGHIIVAKTNNLRVGENIIVNRLSILNNKIPLEWLNLPYGAFKKKIKELFL